MDPTHASVPHPSALLGALFRARRLGKTRNVVLLGVFCGLMSAGTRLGTPLNLKLNLNLNRTNMESLLPFLTADLMGKPAWVWNNFAGIVVALLTLDLGVLYKGDKEISVRKRRPLSAEWIPGWVSIGAVR